MARIELGGAETTRRFGAGGRGLKLFLLPLALLASAPAVSAEAPDSEYSTKETRAVMHRYASAW